MKAFLHITFLVFLFAISCTPAALEPKEYMNWVKNEANGLRVSKQVGQHTFSLQYKTCEYEALLHGQTTDPGRKELDAAIAPIKSLQYFTFCIVSPEKKDPAASIANDEADYNQRLNYLMFDMQHDFLLIDGKDTLPCQFYHYERNYNVSAENNILLGFESVPGSNAVHDKTLIYDDKLLNSGPVLLTIKAENIESIPNLKLTH